MSNSENRDNRFYVKGVLYDPQLLEVMLRPLFDQFGVGIRTRNCLRIDNIVYVGDLVQRTEQEMLRTPNFSRKCLEEVKSAILEHLHLQFDMRIPFWPNAGDTMEKRETEIQELRDALEAYKNKSHEQPAGGRSHIAKLAATQAVSNPSPRQRLINRGLRTGELNRPVESGRR